SRRLGLASLAAGARRLPASSTTTAAGAFASTALAAAPFAPFEAVAEQIQHFLADFLQLQAEVHQHLGGDAFLLAEQAEQNVLGADVVVIQIAGLFHRVLDHLLSPRRLRQLAHGDHLGSALDELLDFQANLAE